ncbi:sugar phosphate isomerase/epimerase family protein [Paenibacillus koleovorans]|uniref:sugar phosphate isomerase/epimerase family protein n=1 Tax=Paenibacillus koleovorans TaxID=121608 RepID=UPI000FD72FFD|nr:sugar phosphate isomerase/epimerase family protein [Paenibacillus koleovorans]
MLKSINHWSFPKAMPLEDVFEHAQKAGYDAIELNLGAEGAIGPNLASTAVELREIRRLADTYGLKLRSLSCGLMWDNSLSAVQPEVRERGYAIVVKQLETASELGADTILTVPGYCLDESTSYDSLEERSEAQLERLLPIAERHAVTIALENVWNKFLLSPTEMARFIDAFDSPWLGVYFDVGNVMPYGHPDQWIRILGNRIRKVHVKDFRRAVGNGSGFVPLLSGDVPWKAVMRALREIGYADTLTAEIGAYQAYPVQAVYDTSRHLDVLIEDEPR